MFVKSIMLPISCTIKKIGIKTNEKRHPSVHD